jgi:hypothetical protein
VAMEDESINLGVRNNNGKGVWSSVNGSNTDSNFIFLCNVITMRLGVAFVSCVMDQFVFVWLHFTSPYVTVERIA